MPKTIDDIIPPSRRRQMTTEATPPFTPNSSPVMDTPTPPTPPPPMRIRSGRSFPYGTALIVLIVLAVCGGVLYAFSGAQVIITPNSQNVTVSGDFSATSGSGDLPFTVITSNKTATQTVPAESTETVNDSAQGQITVSNAQSKAETLINNTRFETPSGLVYRVHTPITIPAGSASSPGTITVTIYADQPGQQYDTGPTTFTVPGLQGTSEYSLVTAKSVGSMTGGFSGTRAAVSQSTDDSTHASMQTALATELQGDIASKVPSGDVLVPGATFTSYISQPDSATTSSSVIVSEQGTASAIVFPATALAKAISYKSVGTYSGEPVTINDVSTLNLTPDASDNIATSSSASSTPPDLSGLQTFDFSLTGSANIIWQVDPTKIAGAVAGKTQDSAQNILSGFPEVDKAVLILRPFWVSTFPSDPSHIKVTVASTTASQ